MNLTANQRDFSNSLVQIISLFFFKYEVNFFFVICSQLVMDHFVIMTKSYSFFGDTLYVYLVVTYLIVPMLNPTTSLEYKCVYSLFFEYHKINERMSI